MTERKRRKVPEGGNNYFISQTGMDFISSGCCIFDRILGGGHPLGRIVNVVGDRSTGKTLLALETIANFKRQFPDSFVYYHEAEAAFDLNYARALGVPVDSVTFLHDKLVEDWYTNIESALKEADGAPCLYILDSLDALSDLAESKRDLTEGSFGMAKAKQLGVLFRKLAKLVEEGNMLLYVISQIRDKINVTFGEKKTRSGGHALDFYASQIVWLSELRKLPKTVDGLSRIVGVEIKALIKKNKVGLAYRDCTFPILFGYGIDSVTANLKYLESVKQCPEGITTRNLKRRADKIRDEQDFEAMKELDDLVKKVYIETETKFLPLHRKYEL